MNKHQSLSSMLMRQLSNCQCCQQIPRKVVSWEFSPFQPQIQRLDTGLEEGKAQERGYDSQITWARLLLAWCWPPAGSSPSSEQPGCAASLLHPGARWRGAPGQTQGFPCAGLEFVFEKKRKPQFLASSCRNKLVLSYYIWITFSSRAVGEPGWQEHGVLFQALPCVFPVTRAFFFTPWGLLFLAQLLSVSSNEVLNSLQRSYSLLMCSYSA